ncbi:hypothetical protein NCAS_0E00280 [Naumovozyma castellii]|uniref:DOC domain-containing protein n=1 Tax=Naumovozyma castellii TaxID=27288 RepID=G0VF33_NAUCA|nr:hypothetical protein NCAS_0E00280 [Naumovozyma castellii CBS 4309]CCC70098.1 hypothetical protein NCAS_0E00280 [Naumovozyma castellii CBS 4309]
MDADIVNNILNKLAPKEFIKPVDKLNKPITILNDGSDSRFKNDSCEYMNGPLSNKMREELTPYTMANRFTLGLERLDSLDVTNVTHLAYWRPSSSKVGNPIENALDDDPDTFWQSDGKQPHKLDIYFSKKMSIIKIGLYISLHQDESYTPREIKIYVGSSPTNCNYYKSLSVNHLDGWVALSFIDNRPHDKLLKCRFIRLEFPFNHENGKDTHIRGIRVYAPSTTANIESRDPMQVLPISSRLFNEFALK